MDEVKRRILDAYYDPEQGLLSSHRLYLKLRDSIPGLTLKQVRETLASQEVAQVTTQKPVRRKGLPTIRAHFPRHMFQTDLMVYDRHRHGHYRYILTCIDVYSRYAAARPLTTKRFDTIMTAMRSVFDEMGVPVVLYADQEFNTHTMNRFGEKHRMRLVFSDPDQERKNAVVERFHRTLADMLQRNRVGLRDYDWPTALPKLIRNYNNTEHSTINQTPADVWTLKEPPLQEHRAVEPGIAVGDRVRVRNMRKTFTKGDELRWSRELFEVTAREGQRFRVRNLETGREKKRLIAPSELLPVKGEPEHRVTRDKEEESRATRERDERRIDQELRREGIDMANVMSGPRKRTQRKVIDH